MARTQSGAIVWSTREGASTNSGRGSRSISFDAPDRPRRRRSHATRLAVQRFADAPAQHHRCVGLAEAASSTGFARCRPGGNDMAKYGGTAKKTVKSAMKRRKAGTLKSGSGRKVTSRKQAIAIGLSEAREKGGKVPSRARASGGSATKRSARSTAKRTTKKR
jgi:hypothetical protein